MYNYDRNIVQNDVPSQLKDDNINSTQIKALLKTMQAHHGRVLKHC